MAKAVYCGVGGIARKVKNIYCGVGGVARRVKKAYIGVDGIARLFYSAGGELSYYGRLSSTMMNSGYDLASASIANFAVFAGGNAGSSAHENVTAIDSSLTWKTAISTLSPERYSFRGAANSSYVLFGPGSGGTNANKAVDTYNTSLTMTTNVNTNGTCAGAAVATVGEDYIIVGHGGTASATDSAMKRMYAYRAASSCQTMSPSIGRRQPGAIGIGNYAIFAGGINSNNEKITDVIAYDSSLTETVATPLSYARANIPSAIAGGQAVFFAAETVAGVDVYNSSLTRTYITTATVANQTIPNSGTSLGDYALFGLYRRSGANYHSTVYVYDSSLTRTTIETDSSDSGRNAAASAGNYAFFAGGMNSNSSGHGRVHAVVLQ